MGLSGLTLSLTIFFLFTCQTIQRGYNLSCTTCLEDYQSSFAIKNVSSLVHLPQWKKSLGSAHWATLDAVSAYNYGCLASLNVYGLPIKSGEESAMGIWVVSGIQFGSHYNYNAIQAGWNIRPDYYGDTETHFFISWIVETKMFRHQTGCYNLDCQGFVFNKTSKLKPGDRLQPLSQYNGKQRFITLKIVKDPTSKDWWLYSGPNGANPVGYWPKSLFTSLVDHAQFVSIGGFASCDENNKSPPMGSGHDVSEGEGKAASIKYPRLINENGKLLAPNKDSFEYHYTYLNKKCNYKISGDYIKGTVYVGGPGGC